MRILSFSRAIMCLVGAPYAHGMIKKTEPSASKLFEYAKQGELKKIQDLLSKTEEKLLQEIYNAEKITDPKKLNVKELIKVQNELYPRIVKFINEKNNEGLTALHIAILRKDYPLIDYLLSKKANPNIKDEEGYTPLHYVAVNIQNDNFLTKKLGKNYKKSLQPTPAELITLIDKLIKSGAFINVPNDDGYTPFYLVVVTKNIPIAAHLIKKGVDVNIAKAHPDDHTPLHGLLYGYGNTKGENDMIRLLISAGADVNKFTTTGYSVLDAAARINNSNAIKQILKAPNITHQTFERAKKEARDLGNVANADLIEKEQVARELQEFDKEKNEKNI